MYVRYPLSLRNVEDLSAERGIDISHETVRFWWNRFGPMFAAEIRKKRVAHMRGYPQWRWHLDEVFVKINGKLCYLWRAVDHEGEVLEAVATPKRDKAAALKLLKRIMKKYGAPRSIVTDGLRGIFGGDERDRCCCRAARGRRSTQQPRRKFASAVSATRTGNAALSKSGDAAEVQLNSRPGAQPIQSGAPSRHEASLQAETLCCLGRVARSRGIARLSQDEGRAACRLGRRYFDIAARTRSMASGAMCTGPLNGWSRAMMTTRQDARTMDKIAVIARCAAALGLPKNSAKQTVRPAPAKSVIQMISGTRRSTDEDGRVGPRSGCRFG